MSVSIMNFLSLGFLYQVKQQEVGLLERFGKFKKVANAGLNFKIPIIDKVNFLSLRIQQLNVRVKTKTKDNVFTDIIASVQFRVIDNDENMYRAYYILDDVKEQINSYIFDVIRAEIPKMSVDEVFEKKDSIASAIKQNLEVSIKEFGYEIKQTLVTDIDVEARIVQAMNDIVASEREKQAAIQKAEAKKILTVKEAEADAESKRLQGKGIAEQRIEIIKGFVNSIEEMKGVKIDEQETLNFVLLTQYFDTLKDVANSESNTIMLPNSPSGFNDIVTQMREAIISGNLVTKKR